MKIEVNMKIYSDFYEVNGKEYDLKTNKGIKDLADDIFFYSKYRVGELSNEIENGRKTIQRIIKIIAIQSERQVRDIGSCD